MQSSITKNNFPKFLPYIFLACWSLLTLANFVPAIPQPVLIIGYLWKVEFALAAFLLVSIILLLKYPNKNFVNFSKKEFGRIILPLLLFTVWSGLSVLWAQSVRSAIHHTLLWACYGIFYLLIRQIVAKPLYLNVSIKVAGLVIFILGAACLTEYLSNTEEITSFFTYRYYKYAEASATLLPLFLALSLQSKSRAAMLSGFIALTAWMVIILCLSRTILIAGIVGISLFFAIIWLNKNCRKYFRKSILVFGLLALVFGISNIFIESDSENSALNRFKSSSSQNSFYSRFLFSGIAFEQFRHNPFFGVGADNFSTVSGKGLENYAALDDQNTLLEINEAVLAERAHNEFTQILAELGIVGVIIFVWLILGVLRSAFEMRKEKTSLLSFAALAGIFAFLVSSLASSYSFRVPSNGLCFFFVLAIFASSKFKVQSSKTEAETRLSLSTFRFPLFAGAIICAAMLAFSAVRGASLMYLQFALTGGDKEIQEENFQKALALDRRDPMINYCYGLYFYSSDKPLDAIPLLRFGIDRGITTSVSYFNLATAQIAAKNPLEAEKTLAEGLRVFPRSVFLRTAYASHLEENGSAAKAATEYETAAAINPAQARSWRLAFAEGMETLTYAENRDKQFVKSMELRPTDAIYALLDFQRQFRPNLVRRNFDSGF